MIIKSYFQDRFAGTIKKSMKPLKKGITAKQKSTIVGNPKKETYSPHLEQQQKIHIFA